MTDDERKARYKECLGLLSDLEYHQETDLQWRGMVAEKIHAFIADVMAENVELRDAASNDVLPIPHDPLPGRVPHFYEGQALRRDGQAYLNGR